jgi:two-component system LytT family response regulator/two-component system response regulator LytT
MSISALIIDDEQLAREELKYLLDSVGGVDVVAQGANGIEALDLIEEHHPDLVFLDVQMPGQDGFAVIQRLMERNRAGALQERTSDQRDSEKIGGTLPHFVFATAYDQYAVRAFDVNAVDYLLKPFDRARVLEAVERVRWCRGGRGGPGRDTDRAAVAVAEPAAVVRAGTSAGQADCAGAEPFAAGGPGGDLLCGHRRGRDSRGDARV